MYFYGFFQTDVLGGDYIILVSQDEILSSFAGVSAVLYILHKLYLAILYCRDPNISQIFLCNRFSPSKRDGKFNLHI